ncbi:discoidin domain-containing protein [Joostella sp. CR20]|uniref:discoidin domain-containing protein n=1 Tax=Joostella sp. CR20 TaxID=2804312 RepID=UPI00313C8C5F
MKINFKKIYELLKIALVCVVFLTCSKDSFTDDLLIEEEKTKVAINPYSNETEAPPFSLPGQKQLNIVYFLPNDVEPYKDYHKRITNVLRHTQNFYAKELKENGFEYKRFGLQEDEENPGLVKIHLIKGQEGKASYPYTGGGSMARNEIKNYFIENPHLKTSEHFLIFIPKYDIDVPYYALGKYGFVIDYENGYDMEQWDESSGHSAINDRWIGVLIHEIGHALNLPHTKQKTTKNFISMMGVGSNKYWNEPNKVKLTKGSALILDNSEVFNISNGFEYYNEEPIIEIKKERIYADENVIHIKVRFKSSVKVKGAIIYNDPKTSETDSDYNSISCATTDIIPIDDAEEFYYTTPLKGFDESYKPYPFKLKTVLVFENGLKRTINTYDYLFKNGKPDIDVDFELFEDFDRTYWEIENVSHEDMNFPDEKGGAAINVLDGDLSTIWHTGYKNTYKHPHEITIDMNKIELLHGVCIVQNQSSYNGMIKDFEVYTSEDNKTFIKHETFSATHSKKRQQFLLKNPINTRYFKIISLSSYNHRPATRLAEVGAF